MTEMTLKLGWSRVKFGDVVRQVKDKADPESSGLERYVAGEHMDTDDFRIRRSGEIGSGYLGPAFHMRFLPGHVLYGSRRTYLRKVAVADFEGICANTTFVLTPKDPNVLAPELLPFLMQTEAFHAFSIRNSKGSVNPYINFSDLADFVFALPPMEEQQQILELLNAIEVQVESVAIAAFSGEQLYTATLLDSFERISNSGKRPVAECYEIQLGKMSSEKARFGDNQRAYIKNNNVLWGKFDFSELPTMSFDDREINKYELRKGDLLVCEGGEIGRAAIWQKEIPGMLYQKALHRLRPRTSGDIPEFMLHYLRYCASRGILEGVATGTTIRHLPVEQLSQLKLPFPSKVDQERIASLLSGIVDGNRLLNDRLRAARLMRATALNQAVERG